MGFNIIKIMAMFCMLLITNITYAQESRCDLLSKDDIDFIRSSMLNNSLSISNKGIFHNPITGGGYTGSKDLLPVIKEKGIANVLFENRAQYNYFMRYLEKINSDPCSFKERPVSYEGRKNKYKFYIMKINKKYVISLVVIDKKYIDGIGYPEHSYGYEFERQNGGLIFVGLNPAG